MYIMYLYVIIVNLRELNFARTHFHILFSELICHGSSSRSLAYIDTFGDRDLLAESPAPRIVSRSRTVSSLM